MKKISLLIVLCFTLMISGCGSNNSKQAEKNSSKSSATTSAEDITTSEETIESFTIPSRDTFAEIPDEAELSFDRVVNTIDKTFPKAKKNVKRYYGYMGEQPVDGTPSYVFAIYDRTDDADVLVATAAVTADNSRVYALDTDSTQFWLIEQYQPEKSMAEFSRTVTAAPDAETTSEE